MFCHARLCGRPAPANDHASKALGCPARLHDCGAHDGPHAWRARDRPAEHTQMRVTTSPRRCQARPWAGLRGNTTAAHTTDPARPAEHTHTLMHSLTHSPVSGTGYRPTSAGGLEAGRCSAAVKSEGSVTSLVA